MHKTYLLLPALAALSFGLAGCLGGGNGGTPAVWKPLPDLEINTAVVGTAAQDEEGGSVLSTRLSCSGAICFPVGSEDDPDAREDSWRHQRCRRLA